MIFKRSARRLLGCSLAVLVSGALAAPAVAAPEKPGKPATTKAATKTSSKPSVKTAVRKARHAKAKPAKHPAKATPAPAKVAVPLPRARPQFATASAPNPPAARLSSTAILATSRFSPITPAAASTLPAGPVPADTGYLPPPPAPPAAKLASVAPTAPLAAAETTATPAADIALVKQATDLVRRGKTTEASTVEKSIGDPLARKLVEWTILRSDENDAGFDRLAAFTRDNPSWPNATMLRKRAEGAIWDERRGNDTVLAFFASSKPITAKGKFALARALKAQGDEAAAAALVRQAWREDTCSSQVERMVMETFDGMLTRADHKARMDRRFYDDDTDAGMRMARLLGGTELAIGKAREAVSDKSSKAHALLEAVPAEARHDAGYLFSRAQWLRRNDKFAEAAKLMLSAPRNAAQLHNLDEWWVERRLIARALLDAGDHQTAYRIARDAVSPPKELYRAEHEFTAGWIALRFLKDPNAAYQHFARVGQGTTHPTTLARAESWQGRALVAAGR
jgi:soluble lytic murein transglycosylase